ncbi:MAG: hypothetical protein HGA71_07860 [Azonexaceae bacterium]|nr:hypothetical protein [Azonexaceae bacterium]
MSSDKPRPRVRRSSIETEEERAWIGFYQRVGRDPVIANEVLAQLESDPEMKRTHLALYLDCKESLRRYKARQARNQRIGVFVRRLCHGLFVRPWRSLQAGLRDGSDLAVECLPQVTKEPAVAQIGRRTQEAKLATARTAFGQHGAEPSPAPTEIQASSNTTTKRATA